MSLIVIPSALRNRLWARARARGAGSWVIVCSRRSRWVSSRGWTYRTVGTLSSGVASETKVWITWYTSRYYAKKLLVRHLQAWAECGSQSPGDLSPFVPWQMSAERREALSGPLPMIVPALGGLAQERREREAANTSSF